MPKIVPLSDEPGYTQLQDKQASLTYMTLSHVIGMALDPSGHAAHPASLLSFLAGQGKVWNMQLLLDTLYFSMLMPLLIRGGLDPPDCSCAPNATGSCSCMSEQGRSPSSTGEK